MAESVQFEFATANRIIFGNGKVRLLPDLAADYGNNLLFVVGRSVQRIEPVLNLCGPVRSQNLFHVSGEPTVQLAREGAALVNKKGCDCVVAIGGGSVLDAGKAIAALVKNPGDVLDYLEVIGRGEALPFDPVPMIAVPTTAGTGSEVTRNAVLKSESHQVKVSMRHPDMIPNIALIDPELTLSMPPDVTASTGLDALTQVIEPYVSVAANPLTDGICEQGIRLAGQSLLKAWQNGDDVHAREQMCAASLFGGLSLANAKLGAVHGIAGPFGGIFDAPHGVICARLLPHVFSLNARLCQEKEDKNLTARFERIARLLTGKSDAGAETGAAWLDELCQQLQIPALHHFGLQEKDIEILTEKSLNASSMKGNPVQLTPEQVKELIRKAI